MAITADPNDVEHDYDTRETCVVVEDDRFAGWHFFVWLDTRGRAMHLGIEPPAGTGVTSTVLQRIRLEAMRRAAVAAAALALRAGAQGLHRSQTLDGDLRNRADRLRRRTRGSTKDEVWYAAFAERYVELVPLGAPGRKLAEEYHMSHEYVRYLVNQCRKVHGMLTDPPKRGVAGGDLTDKARRVLMDSSEEG